jgi:hypothetical protein
LPFAPPGPPGFDQHSPSAQAVQSDGEARRLVSTGDGQLRYELDENGNWRRGTAVQQGVALSLSVKRGTIPSAPTVGNDLDSVPLGQENTEAAVIDAVRQSYPLSDYLRRGLVETISISHEERPHGGLLVQYVYRERGTDENKTAFSS